MISQVPDHIEQFLGRQVVVETEGYLIFAGTLAAVGSHWLTLEDCDMHDHRESNSTREVYVMDIAKHGIRKNRDRVLVRLELVVAVSLTSDITNY